MKTKDWVIQILGVLIIFLIPMALKLAGLDVSFSLGLVPAIIFAVLYPMYVKNRNLKK